MFKTTNEQTQGCLQGLCRPFSVGYGLRDNNKKNNNNSSNRKYALPKPRSVFFRSVAFFLHQAFC